MDILKFIQIALKNKNSAFIQPGFKCFIHLWLENNNFI